MRTYYRYTRKPSPMSDWGYAMFVDNPWATEHYGCCQWLYDGTGGVNIEDLEDTIKETWLQCQEAEDFGNIADEYYQKLSAHEVYENFNPANIVDSAAGYDCELVEWLWQFILEPHGIYAVLTQNGAVVFDPALIKKGEGEEY